MAQETHIVVGGGFIGLCSAYYLAKSGRKVVVVNRDATRKESCSDRNAGMIVPSHFIPLAAPGVVLQGIKWMLNPKSPFSLKPNANPAFWSWCWQFCRHANQTHVDNHAELLRDMSLESRRLFRELEGELGFTLTTRGLAMLCQTPHAFEEEKEVAAAAKRLGVDAEVCTPERLKQLDPNVSTNCIGGVWFPQDAHLDTLSFLNALTEGIQRLGGTIINDTITDYQVREGRAVAAVTASGETLEGDHFTIACGNWTPALARRVGLKLPMQGGKGYSFTLNSPRQLPQLCYLLKEGRVAVTPMGKTLRVAGTMQLGTNDLTIDHGRTASIIDSFCSFFPKFEPGDFAGLETWVGLRPCSPDGLPYIGRAPKVPNVVVASAHSMLGLSLAPVTARMVCDLHASRDVDARLSPVRYQ